METLKITSWNVQHLDRLVGDNLDSIKEKRRDAIAQEIQEIAPDILCILEGPRGEEAIEKVTVDILQREYQVIKAPDGDYQIKGNQWIWFLVKKPLVNQASLLPAETWNQLTSKTWEVNYWGEKETSRHSHYRHPQVLIFNWQGQRIEFIGLHLKSKYVNRGQSNWASGGEKRSEFIRDAIKARIKLATEATNVRSYLDVKFEQVENPAIFVLGDLNDGPGKELFEEKYLFFDLLSNLQGDVFFAKRFLNHALFDYPHHLRWTVKFKDFIQPERNPHILLDHIMFTQPLVDGSLPFQVNSKAGWVEHEIHDLINASLTTKQKTSDHKPVSVVVEIK